MFHKPSLPDLVEDFSVQAANNLYWIIRFPYFVVKLVHLAISLAVAPRRLSCAVVFGFRFVFNDIACPAQCFCYGMYIGMHMA